MQQAQTTTWLGSPGEFAFGCNYWASHAGTAMWSDWRPEVVEEDLRLMAKAGIRVLRVFPLWPDFQPVKAHYGIKGSRFEYVAEEEYGGESVERSGGMSEAALAKFAFLCERARVYDMEIVVGLITGWMSGRLFVPPILEGRNIMRDPLALQWQARFAKHFVARFREESAIVAWDLGNECNCMGDVVTREEAWTWSAMIANAIRASDATRPIISGMHSLGLTGNWTIGDQAELTDLLTTHTYPVFTPYCDQDPLNTIRTVLHPVAETLLYRGVGGKPCFVEEIGTLGPMFCTPEVSSDYLRSNLFTLWAHDCRGLLWWCAFDQQHLTHPPYDWNSRGSEYGLLRADGSGKPELRAAQMFTDFLARFPHGPLPERIVDGVYLLTRDQDHWGAAYGSYVLAKQAGLELEFQSAEQPLREANIYLMPCIKGSLSLTRHRMTELLERVHEGATLYISMEDGTLSGGFLDFAGLRIHHRELASGEDIVRLGEASLPLESRYRLDIEVDGADVLAVDQHGRAAYTVARYGEGHVYYLNYPLETYVSRKSGVFHQADAAPYWSVYRAFKEKVDTGKIAHSDDHRVGLTEHPLGPNRRVLVAINYATTTSSFTPRLADGWQIKEVYYGGSSIGSNDAMIALAESHTVSERG